MTLRAMAGGQPCPFSFPPFSDVLDRSVQRQLLSHVTSSDLDAGQVLVRQGDFGRDFLVVASGIMKLWKSFAPDRRQIVAFRGPGDPLTLQREGMPWSVTAQAVKASRVFKIAWKDLQHLAQRYPAIDRTLYELACDEIATLQNRVVLLGCQTLEGKIAAFILEFLGPSFVPSSFSREVELPMRRPDIADYLGLTTESVSRGFSRLKRERIIALPQPSRVVVRNRKALEALAFGLPGKTGFSGPVPVEEAAE